MDGAERLPERPMIDQLNAEVNKRLIMTLGDVMMRAILAETQRDIALEDLKKREEIKPFK